MWDYVGIVRDRERLEIALGRVRAIRRTVETVRSRAAPTPELVELANIALLGELIVICALSRLESRGLHYTLDHPPPSGTGRRFGDPSRPDARRRNLLGRSGGLT